MKAENKRIGKCKSCRHWKSASDLLAERCGADASPRDVEMARIAIRNELSPNGLDAEDAEGRGWCLSAECGEDQTFPMLSVNMVEQVPIRLVTYRSYGCLNYQPRPRQAMSDPVPDYSRDSAVGRCYSCCRWSGAENEANALFSSSRYTNPSARLEDAQREAYAVLSPPPLDPTTASLRGWCQVASVIFPYAAVMAVDPVTGALGAMITHRDFACTSYRVIGNPLMKTTPDWRILANRSVLHNLGASASLNSLLYSYMDPATLMDPNHPMSPLHPDHPLNLRNPKSLFYNPNPAFAAYVLNPSMANTLSDPLAIREGVHAGRKAGIVDSNRPRVSMQFEGAPQPRDRADVYKQASMQARLMQDFAMRTSLFGGELPVEVKANAVSLMKKGDPNTNDRRQPKKSSKPAQGTGRGGFIDRRRQLT